MVFIGVDVGSVSVKVAAVADAEDRPDFERICSESDLFFSVKSVDSPGFLGDRPVLISRYARTMGEPTQVVYRFLKSVNSFLAPEKIGGIRVTGTGGKLVSELLGVECENEFRAVAEGVGTLYPDVRTIFEMGGDNSKYIRIEMDRNSGIVGISDYEKNGDCAAGTGSFMDQQASRLKYNVEEVGEIVRKAGRAATIAGRCSVFAKTDMIHAQQKGYQPPEILKGLCEAVIRNFKGGITKSKEIVPKVAFIGGVAANAGAVQAMRSIFELSEDELFVPEYFLWLGAIGAALIESRAEEKSGFRGLNDIKNYYELGMESFPKVKPLSMDRVTLLRDRVRPYSFGSKAGKVDAYLGIDVGSVSTNLSVIDENGDLIKEIYTMTEGRPVEVVKKGLEEIERDIGDKVVIKGVGTTGSGRELIGELVGADTVNDEITAHKTGATFIADKLLDSLPVDTVFEIGGQDSKFISIENDIVVDFTMNEACAAGTGSFLEEQAEKLGINIRGEFAKLALSSKSPLRLGERCTVFMEKDVNSYYQRGARKEDIVAGLAYSIVYNYLNRVVRGRKIGDVIFFQGGTAYNDAVAAAFSEVLGKRIVVPPHNGVLGAIGAALLAEEKMAILDNPSRFRGFDLNKVHYSVREFTCKGCSNACDIKEFNIEGEKSYWGDKCSERYRKRAKTDKKPVIPDLMSKREELLLEGHKKVSGKGPRVGIPRSMYFYDRFPFWNAYFKEIGCDVVLSDSTSKSIVNYGIESVVAEPCFPIQVAHGHVRDLIDKGVDYIFQPNVIDSEADIPELNSFLCPWGQTLPFVIIKAPAFERYEDRILKPTIHFRDGLEGVKKELRPMAKLLGVSARLSDRALAAAYESLRRFQWKLEELGREAMRTLDEEGETAVILIGRPYNFGDKGVNLDVAGKLRKYYGINVIPMDCLPIKGIDIRDVNGNMYWSYGIKILQASKFVAKHPNLHIIYITNFKCGPDSYIKHFVTKASEKPYLTLQFDSHSNDAGMMTRCEAYLDSKGFLRWWKREETAA